MLSRFDRFGNQDGQFRLAHDVAVADDGSVYVVDAWGQRVQKLTRRKRWRATQTDYRDAMSAADHWLHKVPASGVRFPR